MYQNYPSGCPELKLSYYSDFSTGVDDWAQSAQVLGTLALVGGQTAPGSPATEEWLRGTYDTTQDQTGGAPGIQLANSRWLDVWNEDSEVGDIFTISYDIYFLNDGGKWDPEGDEDAVSSMAQQYAITATTDVELNTITSVDETITNAGNNAKVVVLNVVAADDRPQAGAVFYIKNVVAKIHRPCS